MSCSDAFVGTFNHTKTLLYCRQKHWDMVLFTNPLPKSEHKQESDEIVRSEIWSVWGCHSSVTHSELIWYWIRPNEALAEAFGLQLQQSPSFQEKVTTNNDPFGILCVVATVVLFAFAFVFRSVFVWTNTGNTILEEGWYVVAWYSVHTSLQARSHRSIINLWCSNDTVTVKPKDEATYLKCH